MIKVNFKVKNWTKKVMFVCIIFVISIFIIQQSGLPFSGLVKENNGVLLGSVVGGAIGSVFGPPGTLIGASVGGIVSNSIDVNAWFWAVVVGAAIGSWIGGNLASGGGCDVYTPGIVNVAACNVCNEGIQGCNEYKCKSIGRNCHYDEESGMCVGAEGSDAAPPKVQLVQSKDIRTYQEFNLICDYTSKKGCEFRDEIPQFKFAALHIQTDEMSRCRVSNKLGVEYNIDSTDSVWLGDSLFDTDHFLILAIGDVEQSFFEECNRGDACTLYIRCEDFLGNKMTKDFYVKYKIKPAPDLEPPVINGEEDSMLIPSGAKISNTLRELEFSMFVYDGTGLEDCKYSRNIDKPYDEMEGDFTCSSTFISENYGYPCVTTLTDLVNATENKFYFRCRDSSTNHNTNSEGFEFVLIGTEPLEIIDYNLPQGTIRNPLISFMVKTDTEADCKFRLNNEPFKEFNNTGGLVHTHEATVSENDYTLLIKCQDEAGNLEEIESTFKIEWDRSGPRVTSIYKDSTLLYIEVDETSVCEYSHQTFTFGDGDRMPDDDTRLHRASLIEGKIYYITCRDSYGNYNDFRVYP